MCDLPQRRCSRRTTPMWCEQAEIRWARCGLFEVAAWPFQSLKSSALTRMWRWCQVQSSQKERAETRRGCCCNFADGVALKVRFSHAQYMKMTRDEHVLGFKSCDISICWWIWMLSFLLKLIWIGIDFLLLKFFATFGSVSGLPITVTFGSVLGPQVTVELQVNSWLQSPTRWEPFVAGTMHRRPESTKERVEPTILSLIAVEIRHLTRFALLLQLRFLRYMCLNHVATWVWLITVARIWIKTRFGFRICIIFCNRVFGLDLNLKNLNYFTGIWKRLKVTA